MSRKEFLAGTEHVSPLPHHPTRPREPLENEGPVLLGHHPPVEQDHGAYIAPATNQAPKPLFELERRVRHEVVGESVQSTRLEPLEARGGERLARDLER